MLAASLLFLKILSTKKIYILYEKREFVAIYSLYVHFRLAFLPKINNGEPLYVGFFHTGAYQDQISGYGGIKHCLIPSPKHIIIDHDKNGKMVDWVYAKEQSAQSMLKILGYVK